LATYVILNQSSCSPGYQQRGSLLARINANRASIDVRKSSIRSFSGTVGGMRRPTDVTDGEAESPTGGYEQGIQDSNEE
jgi:hypothetical protein